MKTKGHALVYINPAAIDQSFWPWALGSKTTYLYCTEISFDNPNYLGMIANFDNHRGENIQGRVWIPYSWVLWILQDVDQKQIPGFGSNYKDDDSQNIPSSHSSSDNAPKVQPDT